MQTLEDYINQRYQGNVFWFESEVKQAEQFARITNVLNNKDYLSGVHKVLQRKDFTFKNQTFEVRKTIFQTAKSFISFFNGYLLSNPISLGSNDEKLLKDMNMVYRNSKYNKMNFDICDNLLKYGCVYEYVYYDNKTKMPKSRIINGEDGFPILSEDTSEYIGFIESYTTDTNRVTYYNVFYGDRVETWNNEGSYIHKTGEYSSFGLPIRYEYEDSYTGVVVSLLDDIKPILNEFEAFMNKFGDSIETNSLNPILTQTGAMLEVPKGIDVNANGYVLHLDDGAEMKYVVGQLDTNSIKLYVQQLQQQMCDISCVPSILYGQGDVANISETSIKLLYGKSHSKSVAYKYILENGFIERNRIIQTILELQGKHYNEDSYIDIEFNYNIPMSDKDIIENLSKQYNDGCLDKQTYIEKSPLTNDAQQVIARLGKEEVVKEVDSIKDDVIEDVQE